MKQCFLIFLILLISSFSFSKQFKPKKNKEDRYIVLDEKKFKKLKISHKKLKRKGISVSKKELKHLKGIKVRKEIIYSSTFSCRRPETEPIEQPTQIKPSLDNGLWGLVRMRSEGAKSQGEGIVICIVDTGIDKSHVDLKDNILGGIDESGTGDWTDDNGHGSHVAGIAAGVDNSVGIVGIAPKAKLFVVKALDSYGSGYESDIANGIYDCIDNGAHIISLSLGSTEPSPLIKSALDEAKQKGIYNVCAAGNDGNQFPLNYPAAHDSCDAITAAIRILDIASFSNTGNVKFILPGVDILSTVPGNKYDIYSGTSMATPYAAGMYALMLSAKKTKVITQDLMLPKTEQGEGLPLADKTTE